MARFNVDRERVLRTLTFWLRPAFLLRVAGRFQRIAGFDRSIALASSALTALIPLLIFTSAILPRIGGGGAADDIIERYDLEGSAAEAVNEMFSPDSSVSSGIGLFGTLFLLVAVLSFTRTVQRLIEQTWELPPLSVRNSVNGLKWIAGLLVYSAVAGTIRGVVDRGPLELASALVLLPLSGAFLIWSAYMLSARRVPWRDLVPFGVVAALLLAIYSVGASIYMPRLFETYADRYGTLGVVFALISGLFAAMVVVVGSSVLGREVHDELGRIRRGERPSEDEVRKEWDEIITEGRARWEGVRAQVEQRRQERRARKEAQAEGSSPASSQAQASPEAQASPDAAQPPADAGAEPSGQER